MHENTISKNTSSDTFPHPCPATGPEKPKSIAPCQQEHIVRMWTPFSFHEEKYRDFFPKNPLFRLGGRFLLGLIHLLIFLFGKLFWGLRVEGREHLKDVEGGFVSVCNHVHLLDCVMLSYALRGRRVCFPTLTSNFQIPLVRHIIRLLGAVPLLESKRGFAHTFSQLAVFLKEGGTVHFYPETVLHPYYTGLRGFHRGAFALAESRDVPVVPALLLFRPRPLRLKIFRGKPRVTLRILKPVSPDRSLTGRDAAKKLQQEVFLHMEEELRLFYGNSTP